MSEQPNAKIIGAVVIGFALVGGAFTFSSLTEPKHIIPPQAASVVDSSTLRVPISVTDSNDDGIEDWRDEFVTVKPIAVSQGTSTYILPNTLTAQLGITLFENVVRARNYGPFGRSDEEVIDGLLTTLNYNTATKKIYDVPDISILTEWDNADIRNYANTVAATIVRHSAGNEKVEVEILYDYTQSNDPALLEEIVEISNTYQNYRDDTLKIPVPAFLVKQHLDLINTYQALYEDIHSMANFEHDPAVTLMRLKRYQDDALGLSLALENMYLALEPHASLFTEDDVAVLFVLFSPDIQN